MIINIQKLISSIINEQDIHIHIGSGGEVSSGDSSKTSTADNSTTKDQSQISQQSQTSQQSQNQVSDQMLNSLRNNNYQGVAANSQRGINHIVNNSRPKSKISNFSKTKMKEIYVRDHIRRIGRRPTQQDVDKTFKNV